MIEIIHKMHEIFNESKSFKSGYITSNDKEMIVEHNGERYLLSVTKLNKSSEFMLDDIRKLSKLKCKK